MGDNRITFDHVRGQVYGWQVWPSKFGWDWKAYGPRGSKTGTQKTRAAAEHEALQAGEYLKQGDRLPGRRGDGQDAD